MLSPILRTFFCIKIVIHVAYGTLSKHHKIELMHEISNNVVCATSKASDQPAHTRSLIRDFASRLNMLGVLSY